MASSIFMPLLFAIINFIWVEGQLKSIVGYKLSGFSISARELLGILVLSGGSYLELGYSAGYSGVWVCSGFWCILFWRGWFGRVELIWLAERFE